MPHLSTEWKIRLARLIRQPFLRQALAMAVRISTARHRVGVATVVVAADGRVLMLKHVFHPSAPWGLPGGWLEYNESPATAALRELREETGLTAVLGPVIHIGHERRPTHVGIAFRADQADGLLRLSPEIIEAAWFRPDALPAPLLPFVQRAIAAAVAFPPAPSPLEKMTTYD